MIYYPLDNLIRGGVRDVFIVTGGEHFSAIGTLLGSGSDEDLAALGISSSVNISYGVQKRPAGIAHALGLARDFAEGETVAVVLGDNIYEERDFLKSAAGLRRGAHIFLKEVPEEHLFEESDGRRRAKYGIAEVRNGMVLGIEEKPEKPKSNLAVTGAYVYDSLVFDVVRTLKPSWRGELEITDVNNAYVIDKRMEYSIVNGEWTDAGSLETLVRASHLVAGWKKKETPSQS